MAPQFTEAVASIIEQAFLYAEEHKHTELTENHLLLAFFKDPEGYFPMFVSSIQLQPRLLIDALETALKKLPVYSDGAERPSVSAALQKRISEAQAIAKKWGDSYIGSDHLLLAFWQNAGEPFASWKKGCGLSNKEIEERIKQIRGDTRMDSPTAESALQTLDKYCKNLTNLAREGKLDPVIGRDEEKIGRAHV